MSAPSIFVNDAVKNSSFIGHYQIKSKLGEGGFGEVYEAWDTKLQREVAIKRLKNVLLENQSVDLVREARVAASLRHPAFVKVYTVEEELNHKYIVMELVRGVTLKSIIHCQSMSPLMALDVLTQVASAMSEAHSQGLIHGDLKPANLILESSGAVRILDFGLAIKVDVNATMSLQTEEFHGTVAYMAPELLSGKKNDVKTDIYALGVIFYEMLVGHKPFDDLNGMALIVAQLQSNSATWDYPLNLEAPLIKIIRDMTESRSDRRISSMSDLMDRINDAKSMSRSYISVRSASDWLLVFEGKKLRWVALLIFLIVVSISVVSNYGRQFVTDAPGFSSESREISSGLNALIMFERLESIDKSIAHFQRVLEQNPRSAAAVAGISLAYSLRYAGDEKDDVWLSKAYAGAQQAMYLNDQLALSHIAMGFVLNHKDNAEDALNHCNTALRLEPGNVFAWFGKISALRLLNRENEAESIIKQAIVRFPTERTFWDYMGTIFYERAEYNKAQEAFRKSISLRPDAVFAYANLSATLLHLERSEEALMVLQEGLRVRPSFELYTNLGNTLFSRGDYLGAVTAFEKAVSNDKGNPYKYIGWANLADTLLWIPGRRLESQESYREAIKLLGKRLKSKPDDVVGASRMALYLARVGEKERAGKMLSDIVASPGANAAIHFRAGLTFELIGDRERALQQIAKAKSLGYPVNLIAAEPDLAVLRRDPNYQ